jgi:hypothetical protein
MHDLLLDIARAAQRRYGKAIKIKRMDLPEDGGDEHSVRSEALFIKFMDPDGDGYTDMVTIHTISGTPSIEYSRNMWLIPGESDTAETLLDDIDTIRAHTVRSYWKLQHSQEEP